METLRSTFQELEAWPQVILIVMALLFVTVLINASFVLYRDVTKGPPNS